MNRQKISLDRPENEFYKELDSKNPNQALFNMNRRNDETRFPDSSAKHDHDGVNSQKVNFMDLVGRIKLVDAKPAWIPKNFYEQFAFYENGGTRRAYIYGTNNDGSSDWYYVTLT